jgi:hypothetical protein
MTPPSSISASGGGRCLSAGDIAYCEAQVYPAHPFTMVVLFAAGGATRALLGSWLTACGGRSEAPGRQAPLRLRMDVSAEAERLTELPYLGNNL